MRSNRSVDTGPEVKLRSALHRTGHRFRKHVQPLAGLRCSVDIAFTRQRVAVFVDGCFWHCCPEHGTRPKRNADWWSAKLDANVERDRRNTDRLTAAGWSVVRIWEHQTLDQAIADVESALQHSNNGEPR
jgi:DNA mismatch endonuclease (patch repair protein)